MQDLQQRHPAIITPVKFQYVPTNLDNFLSDETPQSSESQYQPYLVWHACALDRSKTAHAKAAMLRLISEPSAFGIKNKTVLYSTRLCVHVSTYIPTYVFMHEHTCVHYVCMFDVRTHVCMYTHTPCIVGLIVLGHFFWSFLF